MEYFDYDGTSEIQSADLDVGLLLNLLQRQQQQQLDRELERIREQLDERDQIHSQIEEELTAKLDWYTDRLETLYLRSIHRDRREQLKQRINDFHRELRQENRSHWRDRQNLEQERRELLREIDDLEVSDQLFELL